MKKALLTLVLSLVYVGMTLAQFDSGYPILVRGDSRLEIQIEATLDTTAGSTTNPDSIATGWIDISDFDATNEYTQLYYKVTTGGALATDSAWVLMDVFGNESASWTGAVNITQILDTTNSETAGYNASTLSNKRPKFINIVIEQESTVSGGGADDSVDVSAVFRFPIKDSKVRSE